MSTSRTLGVVVGCAALLGSLFVAGPASAANTNYYVDCSATSNGAGNLSSPWNSLSSANSKAGGFSSGDQILLKRSVTCFGNLRPLGSGASGSPVVLGAYGTGVRPLIDANYASEFGVKLSDQSHWVIQDIEVARGTRYGIFVTVTSGLVQGISITNAVVRDVGGSTLNSKNTGLVVIAPSAPDSTNSTGARFDAVTVDGVVAHGTTMWAGILIGSGTGADTWAPIQSKRSTNVTVRNSKVYDVYGDGIVLFAVNNGLIERSLAYQTGIQPTQTIGTPNAIWTWACNGCTVQLNEAYANDSPGVDGGAFDVDYFSDNTIIQYNYGHGNSAYCIAVFGAENYTTSNTIIRYNVCANNGTQAVGQRTEIEVSTWNSGKIDGLQIYNNTFITNHGVFRSSASDFTGSQARSFRNNIIYSTTSNPAGTMAGITSSDSNVWFYTGGAWTNNEPNSRYENPMLNDPAFNNVGPLGTQYQIQASSPAVDSGIAISSPGIRDHYGNPIPRGNATDIGAHESPFTTAGLLSNGGFEAGSLSGWSTNGSVAAGSTSPRSGSYSAAVTGSNAGIYRTITGLAPSTTYSLSGWVRAATTGQQAYLYAKNFGGAETRSSTVSSTGWVQVTLSFATGSNSTSAELGLWRESTFGSGTVYLDDATLQTVPALLSNGGFEAGSLSGWSTNGSVVAGVTSPRTGSYSADVTGSNAGIYRTVTGLAPSTTYSLSGWVKAATSGQQAYLYVKNFGGAEVRSSTVSSTGYVQVTISFTTGSNSTSAELGLWRESTFGSGTVSLDDAMLR